tara:strand:- start:1181 stop:1900 length:720 start_codon:yes stop_codon:yes gene_type:complete
MNNKLCSFPNWKPELWNENIPDNIKDNTNCYSYALNRLEFNRDNKLQPGELSGSKYNNMDCDTIINHIKTDLNRNDIRETGHLDKLNCLYYKIALVLDIEHDDPDYHFYREDNIREWSHKPGGNNVTNLDSSNNIITDPNTADRNYSDREYTNDDGEIEYGKNYKIFCGYYSIPINRGPILYNWDINTEYRLDLDTDTNINNLINMNNLDNLKGDNNNNFKSLLDFTSVVGSNSPQILD